LHDGDAVSVVVAVVVVVMEDGHVAWWGDRVAVGGMHCSWRSLSRRAVAEAKTDRKKIHGASNWERSEAAVRRKKNFVSLGDSPLWDVLGDVWKFSHAKLGALWL
jgi:hypothetical protein